MRKLIIGLGFVLGLTACGGGGPADPTIPSGPSGNVAQVSPVWQPSQAALPLPNDILFLGTQDLTLNLPSADPTDFSDPLVAASSIDGWSRSSPFIIEFRGSLNPASVVAGAGVRLFKVTALRQADPNTGVIPPTGAPIAIERELTPGTDYYVDMAPEDTTNSTVRVYPLIPFDSQATYMLVVTNSITDTNGNNIIADGEYAVAKTTEPLSGTTAALEPLRQLVNQMESVASSAGISTDDIVMTSHFTIQSSGLVLQTVKNLIDAGALPVGTTMGAAPVATTGALLGNGGTALLYTGTITVPYFLHPSQASTDPAAITRFWEGVASVDLGGGNVVPMPVDPATGLNFLTYLNIVPQWQSFETVPLLISVPSTPMPANGYPVAIFYHGVTRNRTDMLAIADTMASIGYAVVAMDQPLHGLPAPADATDARTQGLAGLFFTSYSAADAPHERTFGLDFFNNTTGAFPSPDGIADGSGLHFLNLGSLATNRDNFRQAISDLFSLSKALETMTNGTISFDSSQMTYVGQSLGGIAGSTFASYDDRIQSAVLSVPTGVLIGALKSDSVLATSFNAGLAAAGVIQGTPEYELFLFAAKTITDAGDPMGHYQQNVANNVNILMHEVVGDGAGNLPDMVVPNSVPTEPLTGTEVLADIYGLTAVTAATSPAAAARALVRFTAGAHGSLLDPTAGVAVGQDPTLSARVTIEMQTQMATFIATGGTTVLITDGGVTQ